MGKRSGANGGVVINKASTAGVESFPLAPTFAATKHAIVSLTRNLGSPRHYSHTGLRVVALCPGVSADVCKVSPYSQQFIKYKKETVLPLECLREPGVENIGKAVVQLVCFAPSGTIWTLEGSVLSRIDIPPSKSYLKLKKSFKM
ncbi:hypothetical protein L9F63_015478 [Diploptera punctata]|uniref:15-hydroxyprostaglandin dehydrogenase [NAD(+)] n=1 Tax=Diploptera punctata TaxID=6984 RepID=A0AAD8A560_DIPPU|nr:hypothetical protein L9F63_015478 [Diploptera punctata]